MPYTAALAGIASRHETRRIRRLDGFPNEILPELILMTEEELASRKDERMQANEGVDPDDKFYAPKTPERVKPSQELSRVNDKIASSKDVQFPSDFKNMPAFKPAGPLSGPTVYMKMEDEDEARIRVSRDVTTRVKKDGDDDDSGNISVVTDVDDFMRKIK